VSFQNALVVTGNITSSSGNFIGNGALLTGLPAGYSNTNVASYLPTYSGNIGGTLTTAAQPYVTSVGTLSSLSVTANVSAAAATYTGNVTVSNLIATANIVGTAATAVGINTTANANLTLNAGAGQIITLSGVQNGQANTVGNIGNTTGYFNTIFSSAAVHSGAVNVGSIVNNNANTVGNIGSTTGYFNTLFSVAAVHSGSVTLGSIINAGANGSGNIGSSTGYFNTVFAKATSAQYADLAEIYTADLDYIPGTVVIFGGEQEITTTTLSHDTRVAGVISTNPAYLMNSSSNGLPVAFTGRVPCMVRGPVSKGTILVASDIPGVAEAMSDSLYRPGCILGKSLGVIPENDIQLIEVVVGRF
jgi:hypothetical protein